MKTLCAVGFLALGLMVCAAEASTIADVPPAGVVARIQADQKAVQTWRAGLQSVVTFAGSRSDLFPPEKLDKLRPLTREQKEEIWNAWKRMLDYSMALDSVRKSHARYFTLREAAAREGSFAVLYAAFLAQYRFSMEFIRLAERDPGLAVLLDDPVSELGLPAGAYTRFKVTFLNPARATEFGALNALAAAIGPDGDAASAAGIDADKAALWKMAVAVGPAMTADNALDVVRKGASVAWLPVQTGVAIWMGDTKVWRKDSSLISPDQLQSLGGRLEPGDVLLERREWYLSNVGLPGFWPHAVLFIGDPETRKKYFDDPEVTAWVRAQGQADGDFEKLLESRYPQAYATSLKPLEDSHIPRVIEAIGEGVSFTTLEHSAAADSVAALRPRLSRKEKAVAIFRSFLYSGRPYDYEFDFMTDSAIVCTELVWKSYQSCPDSRGLNFPMLNILGRLATPANELVRQFDVSFGTPEQQFDLVAFLDGDEKARRANESTLDEFRKSWERPKWHVLAPETGADADASAGAAGATRPPEWAQPVKLAGVPNLFKVSDVLYRGAQPTAEGMKALEKMGIRTVVQLRSFHSDEELLKGTHLATEHMYMKAWHPEEHEVLKFLSIVTDTNKTPVFVHCQHGADRTGTMCAIYRMAIQGWKPEDAAREMTDGGYGFHPIWKNLVKYVEEFDVSGMRQKSGIAR